MGFIREYFFWFLQKTEFDKIIQNLKKSKILKQSKDNNSKKFFLVKETEEFLDNLDHYNLENLIIIRKGISRDIGYEMYIISTCLFNKSGSNFFISHKITQKMKKFHKRFDTKQGDIFELLNFFDHVIQKYLKSGKCQKDYIKNMSKEYDLNVNIILKVYNKLIKCRSKFKKLKKV
jgi:hypothetical protein